MKSPLRFLFTPAPGPATLWLIRLPVGLIFFTQPRVNDCDSIRRDRLDIRSLQLSKALPSFSHTARSGIGISQVSQSSGIAGVLFQALSELGNGFFIHPFLPVDPPEKVVIAQFGLELT